MRFDNIIKWGLRLFLLFLAIAAMSVIWINFQLKTGKGSFIEVVDGSLFVNRSSDLIIKNVNVLSPDCSHFIANQNVLLTNGIISFINQEQVLGDKHEIIDGTRKYLIPGLVDSHVHLYNSKNDLLLYLTNGITYVREMLGTQTHLDWREEIKQGAIGPQIFVASEKVNSNSGIAGIFESWTRTSINYSTKTGAKKSIQKLSDNGYDAVKIGSFINFEMFEATLSEAKKNNIPVVGHIPYSATLSNIYTSGQIEIAHVEEITRKTMKDFGGLEYYNTREYLDYLKANCNEIAMQLRENNIAVSTTIWLMESLPKQKFELESFLKEIELKYANPAIVEGTIFTKGWLPGNNRYEYSEELRRNPKKLEQSEIYWRAYAEAVLTMTKALFDNNVLIMAGTDANVALAIPGYSLHDELESLTKLGVSSSQALYAATVAPGNWMNSNTGKIQPGFNADLILLAQNPLENIRNLQSIEAVFFNKYWLSKNNINKMLDAVLQANDENRHVDIKKYVN
jgi:imidazolonepropionase-like amidohydrolase